MKKISYLLIFCALSLSAFFTDRNSTCESYIFYQGLLGKSVLPSDYPLLPDSFAIENDNLYQRFLVKRGVSKKAFDNKNRFSFAGDLGFSYDDSISPIVNLRPKVVFNISDKLFSEVSIFLLNDLKNPNGYPNKPFKDMLIGGFDRGFLCWKEDSWFLLFGRNYYHSSFDKSASMLFDYSAPPMDGFWFSGNIGEHFSFDAKFSSLGMIYLDSIYRFYDDDFDMISRFLSFHKLTYKPADYLQFSFSESVIFGRSKMTDIFEYTFPFFIFYAEQNNIDINDNVLWSFDANYNWLGKANLSYSFLVDDYQYENEGTKDLEPPELGHILRFDIPADFGVLTFSYRRINAWVYNQIYPWNRYTVNDKNIGYPYGPDIQEIIAKICITPLDFMLLDLSADYAVKGDNFSNSDWVFPIVDLYYYFTEIEISPVSRYIDISLKTEFVYKKMSYIVSCAYRKGIENADNNLSVSSYISIRL